MLIRSYLISTSYLKGERPSSTSTARFYFINTIFLKPFSPNPFCFSFQFLFNTIIIAMLALRSGVFCSVLILLFTSTLHQQLRLSTEAAEEVDMVPLVEQGKVEMRVMANDSRRKLGSFQICSLCTCCGGASRSYCLPSPCCYAINCNIPNRPFGFCSFTPKTCNCFGCHI